MTDTTNLGWDNIPAYGRSHQEEVTPGDELSPETTLLTREQAEEFLQCLPPRTEGENLGDVIRRAGLAS